MGQGVGGDEIRHRNWKRVVEPFGDRKKSCTLNVERANALIRRSVVNLYPKRRMMAVWYVSSFNKKDSEWTEQNMK